MSVQELDRQWTQAFKSVRGLKFTTQEHTKFKDIGKVLVEKQQMDRTPILPLDCLQLCSILGTGTFATVFDVRLERSKLPTGKKPPDMHYALKLYPGTSQQIDTDEQKSEDVTPNNDYKKQRCQVASMLNELFCISRCFNNGVGPDIFGIVTAHPGTKWYTQPFCVLFDNCGQTLSSQMDKFRLWDIEKRVALTIRIMTDLSTRLQLLHKNEFIHRDLSPNNVMVDQRLLARFVDLGTTHYLPNGSCHGYVGTVTIRPPESYDGQYSFATDVFALGCLAFLILTGSHWQDKNIMSDQMHPDACRRAIQTLLSNTAHLHNKLEHCDVPFQIRKLVCSMLQPLPEKRPSIGTVVHEFARLLHAATIAA